MKKIRYSLLFLFLSFFLSAYGQNVEKIFRPGFFSTPTDMIPFGDNQILIGGVGRNDIIRVTNSILVSLDTLGNVLWIHDFVQNFPSSYERIDIKDVFTEDNNIIAVVQALNWCDTSGGSATVFKMNSEGQVLEQSSGLQHYSELVKCGDEYGSVSYSFFSTWDSIYQVKSTKYFDQSINNGGYLSDLICWESFYLASVINNDYSCGLIKVTPTEIFQYYSLEGECIGYLNSNIQNIEKLVSGEIFIQNDHRIALLDSSLNELDEMIFPDSSEIVKFKIFENNLIFIIDSLSKYSVKVFDKDFNLLHNVDFEDELKLIPKQTFIKNNKLYVAGEERSKHLLTDDESWIEDDSRSSIFFRTYNLTEVNEFPYHDIGLSQISIAEFPVGSDSNCNFYQLPECGATENIEYKNVFVTISNYGNTLIDSCTVNGRVKFCGNCNSICGRTQTYSMNYENLNLMPGESKEVLFGDILIRDQPQVDVHELCLWTANPNSFIDKNIDNDESCLESIVALNELTEVGISIDIFPNPSSSGEVNLSITSIDESKIVNIFDALGRIVGTNFLKNHESDLSINVSNYSKGVYFISVKSDGFFGSKKMVIN